MTVTPPPGQSTWRRARRSPRTRLSAAAMPSTRARLVNRRDCSPVVRDGAMVRCDTCSADFQEAACVGVVIHQSSPGPGARVRLSARCGAGSKSSGSDDCRWLDADGVPGRLRHRSRTQRSEIARRGVAFWALAVAVAIAGCGIAPASASPDTVVLLTGREGDTGCLLDVIEGELVADPNAGSVIVDGGVRTPIRWPYGFAGRRSGAEVEILDPSGHVIARTGTRIRLGGGAPVPGVWLACPEAQTLP